MSLADSFIESYESTNNVNFAQPDVNHSVI